MRNKQYILSTLLLFLILSACNTQKHIANNQKITSEVTVKPDFLVRPEKYKEKLESTDCRIIEMKQYENDYLDIMLMPTLGCKSYNYQVLTMPVSQQDTQQKLVFMLIQNCNESVNIVEGKKILRIDLSEILSTIKNQKTIEISFTNSNQSIKFNLEK